MCIPTKFALTAEATMAAVERAGFAHLVTHGAMGMVVTPLPFVFELSDLAFAGRRRRHGQRTCRSRLDADMDGHCP